MIKTRSGTDIISEDEERLINNININLVVDKQSTSSINDNDK